MNFDEQKDTLNELYLIAMDQFEIELDPLSIPKQFDNIKDIEIIGLFAAIPAVIAYNRFNAKVDNLAMTYENFSDEFAAILHRRVHQRGE